KIGPETASSSFFSFIGIKRYNFYYDVSYPVLVDIYDSEAFNNQGYHFYAGLEANVRNNKALNCSGPGVSLIAPPTGSMFCDVNQGCADITIETKDAKTNRALEGVTVYYSSGRESCDKGFSKIKNNMAIVEASLPQCVGTACSLNAVKEGYWTYPKRYAVRCGDYSSACINDNVLCDGENLKIELEPYRDNDIIVKKKMMVKQGQGGQWVFDNTAHDLNDKEYASIMLTKIKESADEEDFIVSSIYYGNESAIKLYPGIIPGRYELRIDLMYKMGDDEKVVFREVEECSGEELSDEKCVTVGPYEFNETMIEGGAVLNISITKDMLDSYNALTFYALSSPDIATNYDVLDIYDIEEMGKTGEYSKKYKVELKPTAS
ncbi:MAG: hypothetical protein KAU20_02130, partial [Nanoarchaeota archaeon]|nr:hypothetical protein [Nanoarchaeota archaeon]